MIILIFPKRVEIYLRKTIFKGLALKSFKHKKRRGWAVHTASRQLLQNLQKASVEITLIKRKWDIVQMGVWEKDALKKTGNE